MREPKIFNQVIAGESYFACAGSYKEVVEYVHWSAGRPLKAKEGWELAKRYLPKMSYANFVTTAGEMARGKGLVRLQHGVYIHKDVLAMLS